MDRKILVCPSCERYVAEADTEANLLLCGTCLQVFERHELKTVEV
jgi:hypothetical protein